MQPELQRAKLWLLGFAQTRRQIAQLIRAAKCDNPICRPFRQLSGKPAAKLRGNGRQEYEKSSRYSDFSEASLKGKKIPRILARHKLLPHYIPVC